MGSLSNHARHVSPTLSANQAGMNDPLDIRRKRLRFRSWHRGSKEADILLGNFADKYLNALTVDQIDRYEELIAEQDIDLVSWITGNRPVPAAFDHDVMAMLQRLDYVDITT